ncbi:acyltransferase [Bradyrhizobium sp. 1]|uniref:acyltransferase family protein n=1 Tax=Bradyrhizobium sp. 1 TaxID=241591 RepID=UPI001FF7C086|nr:acyltransferase [Bradyrhizobium sp. 1]MCK1395664.1 acyltransferase [Bradyrhizobium sp. 1]
MDSNETPPLQPRSEHTGPRIEFANKLRGIAAVSVVFYHYAMFWIFGWPPKIWGNLPDVPPVKTFWLPFLYQFPVQLPRPFVPNIDWGAFGVGLFFLLSGFVIANSVRSYRPSQFLLNRALRIYPTYAVGFMVVLTAHAIAGWIYGRGLPYSAAQMVAHTFPGVRQVFNTAYIDPIIWTLEVEIKFYLVAFIAMSIRRNGASLPVTGIGLGIGAATLVLSLVLPSSSGVAARQLLSDAQFVCFILIGSSFFEYWIGASSRRELTHRAGAIFALFALTWIVSEYRGISIQWIGRIWSYAAALAIFALAMKFSEKFESRNRLADFYARISYPLYVVHLATGYLVLSLLHATPLPIFIDIAIAFAASTAAAFMLHLAVEAPTMKLARAFARKKAQSAIPAPEPVEETLRWVRGARGE